jgi:hypothetical protein
MDEQIVESGANTETAEAAEGQRGDDRDYDREAREMGWVPQDQFHDDPSKWVDAKDFVERGEHILPILRANNKKFRKELTEKDAELKSLKDSVEAHKKVIKTIQKHYGETLQAQVEAAKKELREQLREAKQTGDVDGEIEVQEKLEALKEQEKLAKQETATAEEVQEPKKQESKLDPAFQEWAEENKWFGDTANKANRRKTEDIIRIAEDLREEGEISTGKAFMNKCVEEYNRRNPSRAPVSKVEGSGRGAHASSGGRAYDRLPKEAKEACMADRDMFVGPGKMFKEVSQWQDHYASIYNEG